MKLSKLFLALVLFVGVVGCNPKANNQNDSQTNDSVAVVTPNHIGSFEGTLPCADCPGIKTDLTIREDSTYDLRCEYLESEPNNIIETSGVYSILANGVIELVTPSTNEKTYYKPVEGGVALVADSLGILTEGEMSELYVLKRK